MHKILFIVPPNTSELDFLKPSDNVKVRVSASGRRYGHVLTDMPLGVLSLSAYVKKHFSVETALLDFNVVVNLSDDFEYQSFDDMFRREIDKIRDLNPTIIGISSLFSTSYSSVLGIGNYCKTVFPEAVILAGGNMPTNAYKNIYADSACFDAVCCGEGELPMKRLIEAEDPRALLESDTAWITRRKVEQGQGFTQDFIFELDEIPFDYSLVDIESYQINPTLKSFASHDERGRAVTIMTSRGCPFRCIFCASHRTHGRTMRYHSLERVKEDILAIKNRFGVGTITFQDDHFLGNKERAYQIVRFLSEQGLTGYFPNSMALYALDKRLLEALRDAGVGQLTLAVESGSDRVLRQVIHKPLKLDIVRRVADDCRDAGIYTDCNILVGLPGETKADIEDARAFLRTVNANWFRIYVATPLFGSEMYDICVKEGYFTESVLDANYKHAVVATPDWTAEYIQDVAYEINLELNFVYNADMRLECWETALKGFNTALAARPDHALAHYYAHLCHQKLGDDAQSARSLSLAREFAALPFWRKYVEMFDLPL